MPGEFLFYFLSDSNRDSKISLSVKSSCLIFVDTLIICMFTLIAVSLFNILDNMATPCSVKQRVAFYDLPNLMSHFAISSFQTLSSLAET